MKSINAKRIAAVAASLLVGLAAAGQGVTFGNIPIINSQGQPVVQIVVGSTAQPSDGVVAANIAAVIGSLAHTSTNITATVSGRSGVNCVVTTPTCTLSNQEVYLGEQGLVVPKGSYSFSALIGSVLNPGVLSSGNLGNTKALSTPSSYTYPAASSSPYPTTSNPTATSVYAGIGLAIQGGVSASTNGGGVQFSNFYPQSNPTLQNILELTSTQVPGLLSNSGTYQESESLWLAGFPVYNQNSGALSVLNTNAAYLVTFGKPIQITTNNAATTAQITLLGTNWTVESFTPPTVTGITSSEFVLGGNVTLAQSSTKATTVYVGQNLTAGNFRVVLTDLSYPNSNDQSYASLNVYNNGVLTNVTSAGPGSPNGDQVIVNSSGTKLAILVTQTFPGLYAYQKWAKIQLFSNTVNVANEKNFNDANGNNWLAALRWTTNQSTSAYANAANAALQGIVLYTNQSSANAKTLTPGSTLTYITNPAAWQVNFAGDSLGAPSSGNANYDQLTFNTGYSSQQTYTNPAGGTSLTTPTNELFTAIAAGTSSPAGASGIAAVKINAENVTEPVNLFTVSSTIPTAFQVTAGSLAAPGSNVQNLQYNLDPYELNPSTTVNSIGAGSAANMLGSGTQSGVAIELVGGSATLASSNVVTNNNQLGVTVTGYTQVGGTPYTIPVQFSSASSSGTWTSSNDVALLNVTNIQLSYAIPNPGVSVYVYDSGNTAEIGSAAFAANAVLLGYLTWVNTPTLLYHVPQYTTGEVAPSVSTVTYTGEQNNVNFLNSGSTGTFSQSRVQYFSYTIPEIDVPSSTSAGSNVILGITNATTVDNTPAYYLNQTNGNSGALEYQSTQVSSVGNTKALQGFRTERGGDVASISTQSVVYDEPRTIDGLEFIVGAATSGASNTLSTHSVPSGPYKIGQATNIPNVTIANVTATCVGSGQGVCSVTGLANLTAVPSASQAIVAANLNTAQTPLAVLDSNSNSASTLIVVGSKYVNSVAAQIFAQNPSFNSTFGTSSVVVQAFGTNRVLVAGFSAAQTVQAGNQFIQDLLANATS